MYVVFYLHARAQYLSLEAIFFFDAMPAYHLLFPIVPAHFHHITSLSLTFFTNTSYQRLLPIRTYAASQSHYIFKHK